VVPRYAFCRTAVPSPGTTASPGSPGTLTPTLLVGLSPAVDVPALHSCQKGGQDLKKWKAVEFYEASSWS